MCAMCAMGCGGLRVLLQGASIPAETVNPSDELFTKLDDSDKFWRPRGQCQLCHLHSKGSALLRICQTRVSERGGLPPVLLMLALWPGSQHRL